MVINEVSNYLTTDKFITATCHQYIVVEFDS